MKEKTSTNCHFRTLNNFKFFLNFTNFLQEKSENFLIEKIIKYIVYIYI